MGNEERRLKQNAATLECAFNHKQPWGSDEDAVILECNYVNGTVKAAYAIGRSYEATRRRRYLLHLHIQQRQAAAQATAPHPAYTEPLTLDAAVEERTKQIAAGEMAPTIMQVSGGYKLVPSKFTSEEV